MAIDKNPRQITRLRVEDALNLEKMSSIMYYDTTTIGAEPTERIVFDCVTDFEYPAYFNDSASFNGVIDTRGIQMSDDGATISFNPEDNEFSFQDDYGNMTHLVVQDTSEILTDKSVKTLFGNQSIVGSGNIDLYNHFIKITAGTFSWYGVIQSSNNLDTTGVGTKLQTLLKCKANEKHYYYVFASDDVAETGVLYWTGSVFQIKTLSDNYNVTAVEDKVETV